MFHDSINRTKLITEEEVINILEELQSLGWEVYTLKLDPGYIIKVNDDTDITIKKMFVIESQNCWWLGVSTKGMRKNVGGKASSYDSFINILNEIALNLGIDLNLEKPLKSVRLTQGKPLSNKTKLIKLIRGRKITAIFDPYFDNKSLSALLDLYYIGLNLNQNLRCLTTSKMSKRLTKSCIDEFNVETSLSIEVKICGSSEHRRFLILDDQSVIIIGCSLNNLDKNEAVSEEISAQVSEQDIDFFEKEWNNATNFKSKPTF